jgi:hypothetical protein
VPILDPVHDLAHPVEDDRAWSESYYFNGYDPASETGFFTRVGVRPNEGTIDVGLSVWLPGGELAEHRAVRDQHEMLDRVLDVGGVRYEMLDAGRSWRVTADVSAPARPCVPGAPPTREVSLALDARFDALTPAIGTDGQSRGPRSPEAGAAAASVGRGHFEQAGTWVGTLSIDGGRAGWSRARGNRDRSWGPRRWGGPRSWRWFSINVDDDLHLGGIRLGTDAGELHRGWVWNAGRATSVAEWGVRTELEDDGLTQRVVHLAVLDKAGTTYSLRGDVLRVADVGRVGGTVVNEGLARWTYENTQGEARVGHGICEYLHQLDVDGRPLVPVD